MSAKCWRDNFSNYNYADMHHNLVNGVSLHQHLTEDIHERRAQTDESPVMGKGYYEEARRMWPSSLSRLAAELVVQDKTEPEDAVLDLALEGVVAHKKCFDQLLEWFETGPAPNQKGFVFFVARPTTNSVCLPRVLAAEGQ